MNRNDASTPPHHAMRQQLVDQRQAIAEQLNPPSLGDGGFPRSYTMRFLLRRPQLAGQIFMRVFRGLRGH